MRLISVTPVVVADSTKSYPRKNGVEIRMPRSVRVAMTLSTTPLEKALLLRRCQLERFSFMGIPGSPHLEAAFTTDDLATHVGLLEHPNRVLDFAKKRLEELEAFLSEQQ